MAFDLDEEELRATRKMNKADRDEIEVNEYVRTKNGVIDKVDTLYGMIENTVHLENQKWFDTKNIVKHSKQLIDLIEEGDYVNEMEVLDVYKPKDLWEPIEIRVDGRYTNFILAEDIKTILTKEQMEANCYKVGEENE